MYTLFALFDQPNHLKEALAALEAVGTPQEHCSVVVHREHLDRLPASELKLFETGAAAMTARLALAGAAIGVLAGGILFAPLGMLAGGLLFTTTAGTAAGALTGLLAGASDADPTFARLAAQVDSGQVLVVVEPPNPDAAAAAERVLRRHHAHVVHRHLLGDITTEEVNDLIHPSRS
ncbi:MAG: DUF1269 domain-containing protein [Polyangiaceae bacterium]